MDGTAIINKLEIRNAKLETTADGIRVVFEGGDLVLPGARISFMADHVEVTGSPQILQPICVRFFATGVNHELETDELELQSILNRQSRRRREVLQWLIKGLNKREIAKKLDLTPGSVQAHLDRMKDDVRRVVELVGIEKF